MSIDPLGPESPFGDRARSHESAAAEDFLGLDGDLASGGPEDVELEDEDPWTLASPSIDDFDALDEEAFGDEPATEHLQELMPVEPVRQPLQELSSLESLAFDDQDFDPDDGLEAPDALSFLDDGDETAAVELEPRVPSSDDFIERSNAALEEPETWEDSFEVADTFNIEFEGEVEEELDEHSWLMEFELEEDTEFAEPVTLVSRDPDAPFVEGEFEQDGVEPELVGAGARGGRSPWLARALVAAVSVAAGVVGSKFLPLGDGGPQTAQQVAQAPAQPRVPTQQPAPEVVPETTPPVVEPAPVEVAVTPEPANPNTGPVPEVLTDPEPQVTIDVPELDPGVERRTQELPVEDMVLLAEETDEHVRQATPSELSGMWLGATIPLDALAAATRLLTPNVGRVRVLLTGGEVFEGELYAVGEKKVWLETDLGKMALLDWQIDRIEHILSSEGAAVLGGDRAQDLAGLKSVRVRTAGGVFYGKLLSQEAGDVTLVTQSGARVTLQNAEVEVAGRSTTRLIDASGALADEPEGDELE